MKLVPVSDCCGVRLCSIEFDYAGLLNCSITERSIAFDWQFFFVTSIKFDYRTQSNPIERLGSITERSIIYAGINRFYGCINLRVIFQSAHRIKFFFPIRIGSTVLKCQKLCIRLVVGTARIFTLGQQNVDCMTEKLNILRRSRATVMRLLSQTTSEGLPGVLGNKGTKGKYRREQGNMTPVLGNAET